MLLCPQSQEGGGRGEVKKDEVEVSGHKDDEAGKGALKDVALGFGLMVPWSYQETKKMLKVRLFTRGCWR
jgi:hypothetical protein